MAEFDNYCPLFTNRPVEEYLLPMQSALFVYWARFLYLDLINKGGVEPPCVEETASLCYVESKYANF